MTEQLLEELHALKFMKTNKYVKYSSLTNRGKEVIHRLLLLNLCLVRTVGFWCWKKQVYEVTIEGSMLISRNINLIGEIKHEISKEVSKLDIKSKLCIKDKVEEVLKKRDISLLSFMILEILLKFDFYDNYKIGELQFLQMKSNFSDYFNNLKKQSKNRSDEVFYWSMILVFYQEDGNPEKCTQEYETCSDKEFTDTTKINIIVEEQSRAEDINKQAPDPVVEDTCHSGSTSYDSLSSDESSSYDSGSSSSND